MLIRCIPQISGSVLESLATIRAQLELEMNSSTDNPLIFDNETCKLTGKPLPTVISAGNFHGEYPAKALDTLALYVGELGRSSAARIMLLVDPARNRGLPAFLAGAGAHAGVNSGFMCWELTAVREMQSIAARDAHIYIYNIYIYIYIYIHIYIYKCIYMRIFSEYE